ncbi:GNAT family N-acetyltransferase [Saccharopolyspora sp. NFXS83]|uniref:GNAT family N-acetyltransferase n=1 Tax=Saccharopolyspora sp. NFXS83 TaxID=2993560 RepID=UPI00224A72D6|nr:GNAT family N-acetyltransferase [Saccharopolyspora sp. NFXS83]MCX2731073.1 GNAT family N-acetyltransferase [Saccharopolyspora sp. NFXS83]
MTDENTEVAVARSTDRDRYDVTAAGSLAGFTEFVDQGEQRIFFHTEIGEEFGGRGLGGTLVGRALADTREAGLRVVPVCPFVAKYLKNHHEFDDLVDAVTPNALAAVRERTR